MNKGSQALVLDGESMPVVDLSGAEMLAAVDRRLAAERVDFHLAHDIGQVRDILRRAGVHLTRVHSTVADAVSQVRATDASPPT